MHDGEMAMRLVCLRWRKRGRWNLVIGDRKAVMDKMDTIMETRERGKERHTSHTLETRLVRLLRKAKAEWKPEEHPTPQ